MSSFSPTAGHSTEVKKGLAVASLVLGILSLLTCGCLGVGALAGLVMGIVALMRVSRTPGEYGGKELAIGGIATNGLALVLMPFTIGFVAAIAVPTMLRARVSANESATIGDIRTVISAQAAYQGANAGQYGTMECLGAPQGCIPGYTGPTFLDTALASAQVKSGYARTFHPGPTATDGAGNKSPSSFTNWAYVAVPVSPGKTGVRGFCGDASGIICMTQDGSPPAVVEGACPSGCSRLR